MSAHARTIAACDASVMAELVRPAVSLALVDWQLHQLFERHDEHVASISAAIARIDRFLAEVRP